MKNWIYSNYFCSLYFVKVYILGFLYLLKEWYIKLFRKRRRISYQGTESVSNLPKYAVLTGATRGIGLEVAKELLKQGFNLTIGAPMCPEKALNFENDLLSKFPDSKVNVWLLDLKSLKSVTQFAERYLQTSQGIHLLINNAGVMYVPQEETQDRFEHHLCVNYLSHCLLTKLLLPRLIKSGKPGSCSRIVNTSSSVHYVADINFEDLQSRKCYSSIFCYLQSKLAIVMFTASLQKYLQDLNSNVTVNCLHPGVVYTKLYKNVPWAPYIGPYLFRSPREGAETILHCALSPELENVGGKYFEDCHVVRPSSKALHKDNQKRLWTVTWQLLDNWSN